MLKKTTTIIVCCLMAGSALAQQEAPAKVVQVASVERKEIAPTVAVPGTIYSRNDVQITAGVAGQLLMEELVVRLVFVERRDHVVAIAKRVLVDQVLVQAVGVRVAR